MNMKECPPEAIADLAMTLSRLDPSPWKKTPTVPPSHLLDIPIPDGMQWGDQTFYPLDLACKLCNAMRDHESDPLYTISGSTMHGKAYLRMTYPKTEWDKVPDVPPAPAVRRFQRKVNDIKPILERFTAGSDDGEPFYTVTFRPSEHKLAKAIAFIMLEGLKQKGLMDEGIGHDLPTDPMYYRVTLQSGEELSPYESRQAFLEWTQGENNDVKNITIGVQGKEEVYAALGRAGLGLPPVMAMEEGRTLPPRGRSQAT